MSNKTHMLHIRLDDEQKQALERITSYHRSRTLGEATFSSVIRALIITEDLRLHSVKAS